MSYIIQNNDIYDQTGNVLSADEHGIVKVIIDNRERRFVKDKLVSYVSANPGVLKGMKPVKKQKVVRVKIEKKAPRIKREPRQKVEVRKIRVGVSVAAEKDGVVYGPFISMASCARAIGLTKATVSKIMRGGIKNSSWEFHNL